MRDVRVSEMRCAGYTTPPPGFWQKRLQAIENKGRDTQKERQEAVRVSEERS
jgi:hypothetical protein